MAFLGFDGVVVPSARCDCQNIILFLHAIQLDAVRTVSSKPVDWAAWRKAHA